MDSGPLYLPITSSAGLRTLVRERRRELRITQAELATHIGRSLRWLQRFEDEADETQPALDSVLLLLTALGLRLRIEALPLEATHE